jgi:hypothetical protein
MLFWVMQVYIFKSTLNSSFESQSVHIVKKTSRPLLVNDPERPDLSYQGQLIKKLFFYFLYFFLLKTTYIHIDPPYCTRTYIHRQQNCFLAITVF